MCTKVVRKDIIDIDEDYNFASNLRFGEDLLQSVPIILNSRKAVYIPDYLYCYRRGTGITAGPSIKGLFDVAEAKEWIIGIFENLEGFDLSDCIAETLKDYLRYAARIVICNYAYNPDEVKSAFDEIRKDSYYIRVRPALREADMITKIVIWCAEKGRYDIIAFLAWLVGIKNKKHRKG